MIRIIRWGSPTVGATSVGRIEETNGSEMFPKRRKRIDDKVLLEKLFWVERLKTFFLVQLDNNYPAVIYESMIKKLMLLTKPYGANPLLLLRALTRRPRGKGYKPSRALTNGKAAFGVLLNNY